MAGLLVATVACESSSGPVDPPTPSIDARLRQAIGPWGAIPIGEVEAQPPALVALGQMLVFDKILSGNRDIACATCHQMGLAATDGMSLAVGTGFTGTGTARRPGTGRAHVGRNAPTLLNVGLGGAYVFWDGRLNQGFGFGPPFPNQPPTLPPLPPQPHILASQALLPVLSREEMRGNAGDRDVFGQPNELALIADDDVAGIWRGVMSRLMAVPEYVEMFRAAFPGVNTAQLRFEHAAQAIAAFELAALTRTRSPFDRYLGRDDGALSTEAKRGALLFFGEAQCASCHNGPLLGGNQFANIGIPQLGPGSGAARPLDHGFGETLGIPQYRFAFRVAPLRNVELTGPYMHDGAYATLDAVVRHYNNPELALRNFDGKELDPSLQGSYHGEAATISAILSGLDFRVRRQRLLTDTELGELVTFLKALTDPGARDLTALVPARVPSGLPVDR
jgi:cytochrome c peroxidase